MNYNIKHIIRNGLLAVAPVLALFSCADTWNDHYDSSSSAAGIEYQGTTMQAIQEKAPNFAKVIKAAGYDRELNSENLYTIWVPELSEEEVTYWTGLINAGRKDYVIKKLIKSHVARYNHSLNNERDTITLVNNKRVIMGTISDPIFGSSQITKPNLTCNNGVLHLINKYNPYINNIYELIEEVEMEENPLGYYEHTLYQFLQENDSAKLDESKSVYRGVDENGNRIYVDSVTERYHRPLLYADALIYEEDSAFIAAIPSPAAYNERYLQAYELLNYNKGVVDKAKGGVADSLRNYWANMFAMKDIYFNANMQNSLQDSITSTDYRRRNHWYESVYYDPFSTGIFAPGTYEKSVICSNGDGFLFNEYPMPITDQFFREISEVPSRSMLYVTDESFATRQHNESMGNKEKTLLKHEMKAIYEEGTSTIIGIDTVKYSTIGRSYRFMACEPKTTTGAPNFTFLIPQTLSGTYEIQVVVMPYWLMDEKPNYENIKTAYKFQTTVYERQDETGKDPGAFDSKGTMLIPDAAHLEGSNYALSKSVADDGTLLYSDTISLGNYTFKNCYYDQNEGGVLLQFKPNGTSKQIRDKDLTKSMNILGIILTPVINENNDDEL